MRTTRASLCILAVACLAAWAQGAIVTEPAGLSPGDEYRLVFPTSTEIAGRLSGGGPANISGYNDHATSAATAVAELNALGTNWSAVVSTKTLGPTTFVTAKANTGTDPAAAGVPIYNLAGQLVATGNADLWDGSIANPINVTELGTAPPDQPGGNKLVWTGATSAGNASNDWSLISPTGGWMYYGQTGATDGTWVGKLGDSPGWGANANTNSEMPIYAMSGILTKGGGGPPPGPSDDSLVYESMSHPVGAGNLHGRTGDAGLGAWSVNPSGAGQIVSPGMSYTDGNGNALPVAGNRFETVAGFNDLARASIDISSAGWTAANKEGGKLNKKGAEIWFSALMRANGSTHNHFHLDFTDVDNGNASWANGPGYLAVGKTTGNVNWEIRGDNDDGDADVQAFSTVDARNDTFMVGRFATDDTTGDTTFDVWFNPLIDDESNLGTPDASITVAANDDGSVTQFTTLGYRHQKWESPNLLDEIRMGETFNSVVGLSGPSGDIPEPATMVLLGMAACGLGGYVRRRRA